MDAAVANGALSDNSFAQLIDSFLRSLSGTTLFASPYFKHSSDLICPPFKDLYKPGEIYVVDYKTTKSCDPKEFADSVKYWGYDMQAAWYRRGMEKAGYSVKEFAFVAQEKVPPYASKIFVITDEQMDKAWDKMQVFLDAYNKYLYDGITTIYNSDSIVTLDLED